MASRAIKLSQLENNDFDILVIGGGATGLGIALDAQTRGFKTALIEQKDFASSTSSSSTKLIHGGIRYLEQGLKNLDLKALRLVYEALNEREILLNIAPHLTNILNIVIPSKTFIEKLYFKFGIYFYKLLAKNSFGNQEINVSKSKLQEAFKGKISEDFKYAVQFQDGQFNDTALAIALARTAEAYGAVLLNYVSCLSFAKDSTGKIIACTAKDELKGQPLTIRANWFINATGVGSDHIRLMVRPNAPKRILASKGSHIVINNTLDIDSGLIVPKTKDGRVVFVLPWMQKILIGTTDIPVSSPTKPPKIEEQEIKYLLSEINPLFKEKIQISDITAAFSAYRPLVLIKPQTASSKIIRSHEVEEWQEEHLINVLGGKWTTYRKMAQDCIDTIIKHFPQNHQAQECLTHSLKLIGANPEISLNAPMLPNVQIPSDINQHLDAYGIEKPVLTHFLTQHSLLRLHPNYPYTNADIWFAAKHSFAETAEDILLRRLRLGFLDQKAYLETKPFVEQMIKKYRAQEYLG